MFARLSILLSCAATSFAQSPSDSAFFESRIRPVLVAKCQACHGDKMQMGGLDFSSAAGFARVKGAALMQALSYTAAVKMPPSGKLPAEVIADFAAWVKAGARWSEAPATRANATLWSFQPLKDHAPPRTRNQNWTRTPIDHFILARLEEKRLAPAPSADKATLLRRATFDLTGLPPTEHEVREFLADTSPKAFDKVVDQLLASPRYGERWGRHWLDVARYADSTGADEDHRYPHAWRYRDYVIDAFNRDVPYDRFVMEQIAGDLLPPKQGEVNVEGITATGFLALGPKLIAEQDKVKMLYDIIDEQIDVTGRGVMGLTLACARCHDHKFDPISTKDYYSLASIFASTKQLAKIEGTVSQLHLVPLVEKKEAALYQDHQDKIDARKAAIDQLVSAAGRKNLDHLMPSLAKYMLAAWKVYADGATAQQVAQQQDLDEKVLIRWVDYLKPNKEVRPHLTTWYKATPATIEQVAREYQDAFRSRLVSLEEAQAKWKRESAEAKANNKPEPPKPVFQAGEDRFYSEVRSGKGPFAPPDKDEDRAKAFPPETNAKIAALKQEMEDLKKIAPPQPPMACAVTEGEPVEQRVFIRGEWAAKGDVVAKRFPSVLAGEQQSPITQGSGRLQLAKWLVNPDHPLTARVMANRIWEWHFGEGLVRTPSNFGRMGEAPSHPELLDFLAKRFIESGWSIKAMHRLIMLSATYQMSPEITGEKAKADPANILLSHFSRRRLDIEEIRDSLLALDGTLDLQMGGTMLEGKGTDVEFSDARKSHNPDNSRRRTIYLPLRRSNLPSVLTLFDFGDATTTGEGRSRTNVAPQALYMMNSTFVADRARGLAKLLDTTAADRTRVEKLYLMTLGRLPSNDEISDATEYVKRSTWESLCRVLIASNDFVYVN
jgi:hypothetical protein